MKRNQIIFIVVLLLLLGGVTAWRLLPRAPGVGDLYSRYEHQPGVRVGFVHDFAVDDSTQIDVTTFEALTDSGWTWMVQEFGLQKEEIPETDADESGFLFRRVEKGKPSVTAAADCKDVDILLISTVDRAAGIYHVATQDEEDLVLRLAFDKYLRDVL